MNPEKLCGFLRIHRPGLILLDLVLPRVDGIALMEQVAELADLLDGGWHLWDSAHHGHMIAPGYRLPLGYLDPAASRPFPDVVGYIVGRILKARPQTTHIQSFTDTNVLTLPERVDPGVLPGGHGDSAGLLGCGVLSGGEDRDGGDRPRESESVEGLHLGRPPLEPLRSSGAWGSVTGSVTSLRQTAGALQLLLIRGAKKCRDDLHALGVPAVSERRRNFLP